MIFKINCANEFLWLRYAIKIYFSNNNKKNALLHCMNKLGQIRQILQIYIL